MYCFDEAVSGPYEPLSPSLSKLGFRSRSDVNGAERQSINQKTNVHDVTARKNDSTRNFYYKFVESFPSKEETGKVQSSVFIRFRTILQLFLRAFIQSKNINRM